MTAKEKAIELRDKYNRQEVDIIYVEHDDAYIYTGNLTYNSSTQCAMITVDKIIEELKQIPESLVIPHQIRYWGLVKTELEKL